MDELKQSVQSASYEQKDPLLIYKLESFKLFKTMVQKTNREIDSFLVKCHLPVSRRMFARRRCQGKRICQGSRKNGPICFRRRTATRSRARLHSRWCAKRKPEGMIPVRAEAERNLRIATEKNEKFEVQSLKFKVNFV